MVRRIGHRRRLLCTSPDYLAKYGAPNHSIDLAARNCLVFAGLGRWEMQSADGALVRVDVAWPFIADDVEALVAAAQAGLGILLTTDWAAAASIGDRRLVQVLAGWTLVDDGAITIVTPSGSHHASKTRAFSGYLVERFRAMPWTNRAAGYGRRAAGDGQHQYRRGEP